MNLRFGKYADYDITITTNISLLTVGPTIKSAKIKMPECAGYEIWYCFNV